MKEILTIPYSAFNDWYQLQKFLELRGNPSYELVGDVDLLRQKGIVNLGNLVRIDGNLNIFASSVQSLETLEYVGGYLILRNTPIKSLGNLKYVRDELDLRDTLIQSLGKLEYVGGIVTLSQYSEIPKEELIKFKFCYW